MTNIGKGTIVTGDIHAEEAVCIGGTMTGEVLANGHDVTIEPGGRLTGNVTARTVTIGGTFVGRIIATRGVRFNRTGSVKGDVASPAIVMEDGAVFNGSVEPARVEAALRVAAYRRKA
jgi:cytoskeletal protein CcmA (bactofilin family)